MLLVRRELLKWTVSSILLLECNHHCSQLTNAKLLLRTWNGFIYVPATWDQLLGFPLIVNAVSGSIFGNVDSGIASEKIYFNCSLLLVLVKSQNANLLTYFALIEIKQFRQPFYSTINQFFKINDGSPFSFQVAPCKLSLIIKTNWNLVVFTRHVIAHQQKI